MFKKLDKKSIVIIICVSAFIGLLNNYFSPFGLDFFREEQILEKASDEDFSLNLMEEDYQVKSVTTEKLLNLINTNKALVVDARDQWEFSEGHIKGAYNLPSYIFEEEFPKFAKFPKDTLIIVYCDDLECGMSKKLSTELVKNGYRKVFIYEEGWNIWKGNNLPVESGENKNE